MPSTRKELRKRRFDNMNGREIIGQLLEGSREINRLREEVRLLVGMIQSNFRTDRFDVYKVEVGTDALTVNGSVASWRIFGYQRNFDIECYLNGPKTDIDDMLRRGKLIFSTWRHATFSAEHVRIVHDSLPALFESVVEERPELLKHWKPFLEIVAST